MGMKAKGLFEMTLEVREVPGNFHGHAPYSVVACLPSGLRDFLSVTPFRDTEAEAEKDLADYIAEHAFKEVQGD